MKRFKDFREALTIQQRKLKSRVAKRKSKITAIKRKKSMRKPPTPDKVEKAVNKAVRQKAIDLVDRGGKYKDPDASFGIKANIEKKADIKTFSEKGAFFLSNRQNITALYLLSS